METKPHPAGVPGGDTQADADTGERHSHARTQRAAALVEDYVELIADLQQQHGEVRVTEIARRLGVAHPTAIKAVGRLKRAGLAKARPYRGIFLTEAGSALADRVRVRHRLVVDLLVAVGVPRDAAETDAEGIEHYVSDATLAAFRQYLADRRRSAPARGRRQREPVQVVTGVRAKPAI